MKHANTSAMQMVILEFRNSVFSIRDFMDVECDWWLIRNPIMSYRYLRRKIYFSFENNSVDCFISPEGKVRERGLRWDFKSQNIYGFICVSRVHVSFLFFFFFINLAKVLSGSLHAHFLNKEANFNERNSWTPSVLFALFTRIPV